MREERNNFLGIHKDLVVYFFITLIAGLVFLLVGAALFVYIKDPSLFESNKDRLTSNENWLLCIVCGLFLFAGFLITFFSPFKIKAASQAVFKNHPRPKRIKMIKQEWSDSTDYSVEILSTKKKHRLLKLAKELHRLLDQELEAEVFFDDKNRPVALRIEDQLLWVL